MLFLDGAFGLVTLAVWIFCLIDVITTDGSQCRNLPKGGWVLVVLLLPVVGSVVWLVAGRPAKVANLPYRGNRGIESPGYERPGRFEAATPGGDVEFLRQCRERAEQQRRAYRELKNFTKGIDPAEPE